MKITEELIPLIEKALGFKLYEWQRAYLLEKPYSEPLERATGRTTVYVIKLLLTNREPINIKFDAMKYKDHRGEHYTDFFRNFMGEIDAKLTAVGLPTRTVKPKQSRGVTIEVGVDTDKLQLKLRAIAKHAGALADELDAIDNAYIEKQKEFTVSVGIASSETGEDIANALKGLPTRLKGCEFL